MVRIGSGRATWPAFRLWAISRGEASWCGTGHALKTGEVTVRHVHSERHGPTMSDHLIKFMILPFTVWILIAGILGLISAGGV